ncbi:MAG: hypothetical protein ACREKI_05645, partial [Gemmatimonadota bacterium]
LRTAWSVARGVAIAAVAAAVWLLFSVVRDPYADARGAIGNGHYPAAIEMLERAGLERAQDPERHWLIAQAALHGENYRRARAAVDSLLVLDPTFRDRLTLAALFDRDAWSRRTDHRGAARDLFEVGRVLPPDSGLAVERARHLWLGGGRDDAVSVLREAGIAQPLSRLYALDLASEDCGLRERAATWYAGNPRGAPVEALEEAYARTLVVTNARAGWLGKILPKRDTTYTCDREALARALAAAGAPPAPDGS